MRTDAASARYVTGVFDRDYLLSDRRWHDDTGLNAEETMYIQAHFLDNDHLFEIIDVKYIIERSDITRYTSVTQCAFFRVEGRTALAVELRDREIDTSDASVVIAEVGLEKDRMLLGFIVESEAEFYAKIIRG